MASNGLVKTGISILLSVSLLSAGGLGDFIRNNLNGSISSTNSGYFKTQSGGYWNAGSMKVRWDMSGSNIRLFHAQAPNFNVGCNGIDATFGSFSYLNFNNLVAKLKKIASAAPAMAFQMAIMTLCEQCRTIMGNLEKIADALNNFDLNACQAATGLAQGMAGMITGGGVTADSFNTHQKLSKDAEWGWVKSLETGAKWFGDLGKEGLHNKAGDGSVLNKFAKTYKSSFIDTKTFIQIMRSLIGDVYGFDVPQKDSSGADVTQIGKHLLFIPTIPVDKFVDVLANGGTLKVKQLIDNKNDNDEYLAPTIVNIDITIPANEAFVPLFKKRIKDIINKIETKQNLSNEDIQFINSAPFPLYKIANVQATLQQQISDEIAEYLAYKSIKIFVQQFFTEIMKASGSLLQDPKNAATANKEIIKWQTGIVSKFHKLMQLLNDNIKLKKQDIKTIDTIIDRYKTLQKDIIKRSPIWNSGL
jgi:conjugative transfer pilus assembly protein TraH